MQANFVTSFAKQIRKCIQLMLPLFFILFVSVGFIYAQPPITLGTTADVVNGNTTSVTALIGSNGGDGISLREAILAANNEPNGSTINITMPAGTYTVTIAGTGENLCANGDIDINVSATAGMKTVTINGAGSGATVITGSSGERVFDVHPVTNPGSITFNLSNVTISGTTIASSSGAAILAGRAGDITIISNCVFSNNSAPNSGAITQSSSLTLHDLTVINCIFTGNTATSGGPGALNYNGIGNVTITGCTFSGNTAATTGGAVNITGGGSGPVTANILKNNFLNNTANGTQFGGAAITVVNAQTVNINFNRFVGNNSPNLNTTLTPNFGNGRIITAGGGMITTFNVDNNWWGTNNGPTITANAQSIFGTTTTRWLQLKNTASPSPICNGSASTITAGFLSNNLGEAVTAANLTALVGLAISFNSPVNGTLSGAQSSIQATGTATVTFTSNASGNGSANAVFAPPSAENQTATTSPVITINATPSITANPSASTSCSGLSNTFTATAANNTTLNWQESINIGFTAPVTLSNTGVYSGTGTGTLTISDNAGLGGRFYRLVASNSNGCAAANSTGSLLTATVPSLSPNNTITQATGVSNNIFFGAACAAICKVIPSGGSPVSGNITAQVWVEGTVPTTNLIPFVQRHYQITPAINSTTATATVTLYFSQTEFNNFNAHPASTLDLPANPTDNAGKANLRIGKFPGTSTNGTGLPTSYTSAASSVLDPVDANIIWNATLSRWEVTVDVVGFSGFIVQTATIVVPLQLNGFTAKLNNNIVNLNWKIEQPENQAVYMLLRSTDGINFSTINSQTGDAIQKEFNYSDLLTTKNIYYYRLKMTGNNGTTLYSNILRIRFDDSGPDVIVYPNPVDLKGNIQLSLFQTGMVSVQLIRLGGEVLIFKNKVWPGTCTVPVPEGTSAGTYFILIKGEKINLVKKILIQ